MTHFESSVDGHDFKVLVGNGMKFNVSFWISKMYPNSLVVSSCKM